MCTLARNVSESGLQRMASLPVSPVTLLVSFATDILYPKRSAVFSLLTASPSHPCCGIFHCAIPLANNRHRYRLGHDAHHHICCVEGCLWPVASSAENNPPAFFQLQGRLRCANVVHPVDSNTAKPTVEDVEEAHIQGDRGNSLL